MPPTSQEKNRQPRRLFPPLDELRQSTGYQTYKEFGNALGENTFKAITSIGTPYIQAGLNVASLLTGGRSPQEINLGPAGKVKTSAQEAREMVDAGVHPGWATLGAGAKGALGVIGVAGAAQQLFPSLNQLVNLRFQSPASQTIAQQFPEEAVAHQITKGSGFNPKEDVIYKWSGGEKGAYMESLRGESGIKGNPILGPAESFSDTPRATSEFGDTLKVFVKPEKAGMKIYDATQSGSDITQDSLFKQAIKAGKGLVEFAKQKGYDGVKIFNDFGGKEYAFPIGTKLKEVTAMNPVKLADSFVYNSSFQLSGESPELTNKISQLDTTVVKTFADLEKIVRKAVGNTDIKNDAIANWLKTTKQLFETYNQPLK